MNTRDYVARCWPDKELRLRYAHGPVWNRWLKEAR